jgi:hypothetical protein
MLVILFMSFNLFLCKVKLFGPPIFRFWAYLMNVIPETRHAHKTRYLCVYFVFKFTYICFTRHLLSKTATITINLFHFTVLLMASRYPFVSQDIQRDYVKIKQTFWCRHHRAISSEWYFVVIIIQDQQLSNNTDVW